MDLDYFALSGWGKLIYKLKKYFGAIPSRLSTAFGKIGKGILSFFMAIANMFRGIWDTFKKGSVGTKLSFIIMGSGCMMTGQLVRGIVYLAVEVLFIIYMVMFGAAQLALFTTLGTTVGGPIYDPATGLESGMALGDNSLTILLFSVMTIVIMLIVAVMYVKSIRDSYANDCTLALGKRPDGIGKDISNMLDKNFHTTLLFAPTAGVVLFTIIPLIFMLLIAFTNYDYSTQPPKNLFTWVGFDNFIAMFNGSASGSISATTFFQILGWTLLWAALSTITTYIGGIILALMINKKGIFGKKIYRNIFVLTIAVPQFVSLLVISKFLGTNGLLNELMLSWGWITERIPFLEKVGLARTMVIIVNMWVGLPYTMLSMTGILMNIPEDLYEAAKIDGASSFKMFMKITMPYMLVVTGPYLITQFIGNINNFNVIFLLTGGGPTIGMPAPAGKTDLLITWLYDLTINGTEPDYKMGSVIGILMFAVCSISSLLAYRYVGSQQKEEVFQ